MNERERISGAKTDMAPDSGAPAAKMDVVFTKIGRARFWSHHDLMRLFERAVRRARLPVRMTQGYNPRPRLVFPSPLGLGVASECEHLEIELTRATEAEEVREPLEPLMPDGMRIRSVAALAPRRKGRVVERTTYALGVGGSTADELRDFASALESAERIDVERETKKGRRTVDIRPSMARIAVDGERLLVDVDETLKRPAKPAEIAARLAETTKTKPSAVTVTVTERILAPPLAQGAAAREQARNAWDEDEDERRRSRPAGC